MNTQHAMIGAARLTALFLLALPMFASAQTPPSEEPPAPVILHVYSDYV